MSKPVTSGAPDHPDLVAPPPLIFDLGLALFFVGTWVILLLAAAVVVVPKGVIERKFGEEYIRYEALVRRWF